MGHNHVGTEHLLLGTLIEGEGIAAHVLVEVGVTLERVRSQLETMLDRLAVEESAAHGTASRYPRGTHAPRFGHEASVIINLATVVAAAQGAESVTADHLRYVLEDAGAGKLLEQANRIADVASGREKAVARADFPEATRLRDAEAGLKAAFERAKAAWQKGLGRRNKPKPPDGG
jgi:ATP-dependent Clp protease ATP-binding subunit ClpA